MANRVKEALKVGIDDPVHSLRFAYSDYQGIQRIVPAAPGPKTVREPEEVFLIDLVQYGSLGAATLSISRRNLTLQRIAVYASQSPSSTTTQHSLPGGPLPP